MNNIISKSITNYYRNQTASQKTIVILVLCSVITFFFLDQRVSKFMMFLQLSKSNEFMVGFASIITSIFLLIMVSIYVYRYEKGLQIITLLWMTILLSLVTILLLKLMIFRGRPYISLNISAVGYPYTSSSFPSCSAIFYGITPILWPLWKKDTFFILTPLFVQSICCIYIGESYLSDILVGAAIAVAIGLQIQKSMGKALLLPEVFTKKRN